MLDELMKLLKEEDKPYDLSLPSGWLDNLDYAKEMDRQETILYAHLLGQRISNLELCLSQAQSYQLDLHQEIEYLRKNVRPDVMTYEAWLLYKGN